MKLVVDDFTALRMIVKPEGLYLLTHPDLAWYMNALGTMESAIYQLNDLRKSPIADDNASAVENHKIYSQALNVLFNGINIEYGIIDPIYVEEARLRFSRIYSHGFQHHQALAHALQRKADIVSYHHSYSQCGVACWHPDVLYGFMRRQTFVNTLRPKSLSVAHLSMV